MHRTRLAVPGVGGQAARHACEFSVFFDSTPRELIARGVYNQIAIALLRPDKQIYGLCYQNNAQSLGEQLTGLLGQLKTQLT